ncbi:MAG: hypothetical protein IPJ71_17815 [Bdellovibrionales bacterium]|nr:hypothetical protein [Bdellovibrionales bacterium]
MKMIFRMPLIFLAVLSFCGCSENRSEKGNPTPEPKVQKNDDKSTAGGKPSLELGPEERLHDAEVKLRQYLQVNSEDKVNFELKLRETGSDIDSISEFKVTSFYYNRCDQIFTTFLGNDQESFSSDRILSALKSVLNSGDQNEVGPQRRQTILFLGCLTASPTIQKLLFHNDINDLKSILAAIEDINKDVVSRWKDNSLGEYDYVLADFGYTSRNLISHSILDLSHSLCKEYPFLLDNGEIGLISGYMRIRQHLDKILEILKLNEDGVPQIALDLNTISEQLHNIAAETKIQDTSESVSPVTKLARDYMGRNIVRKINQVLRQANEIPRIDDTKSYEDFRNALKNFHSLVMKFNLHFHVEIESFDANEGAKNDFSEIDQITSQMEPTGKKFGLSLLRFRSQFEEHYSQDYLNGILEIGSRHQQGTANVNRGIKSNQFGYETDYVSDSSQNLNPEKLSKCFGNPSIDLPGEGADQK